MSDYVVVTSTSNTITVINQPSTLVIADSAMRGPTGATGPTGPTGATGATGAAGDRYRTNSNSTIQLSYGYKTLQVEPNLAYTVGQHVTASNSESHYFHGPVSQYYPTNGTLIVFASEWNFPAPDPDTYSKWDINLAGIPGSDGANGSSANIQVGNVVTGAEGSNVTITNVGNSTNVILNFSIPRGNTGNSDFGPAYNQANAAYAQANAAYNAANLIAWTTPPLSNVGIGSVGQAAYDANGDLYICFSANAWSKIAGNNVW